MIIISIFAVNCSPSSTNLARTSSRRTRAIEWAPRESSDTRNRWQNILKNYHEIWFFRRACLFVNVLSKQHVLNIKLNKAEAVISKVFVTFCIISCNIRSRFNKFVIRYSFARVDRVVESSECLKACCLANRLYSQGLQNSKYTTVCHHSRPTVTQYSTTVVSIDPPIVGNNFNRTIILTNLWIFQHKMSSIPKQFCGAHRSLVRLGIRQRVDNAGNGTRTGIATSRGECGQVSAARAAHTHRGGIQSTNGWDSRAAVRWEGGTVFGTTVV